MFREMLLFLIEYIKWKSPTVTKHQLREEAFILRIVEENYLMQIYAYIKYAKQNVSIASEELKERAYFHSHAFNTFTLICCYIYNIHIMCEPTYGKRGNYCLSVAYGV